LLHSHPCIFSLFAAGGTLLLSMVSYRSLFFVFRVSIWCHIHTFIRTHYIVHIHHPYAHTHTHTHTHTHSLIYTHKKTQTHTKTQTPTHALRKHYTIVNTHTYTYTPKRTPFTNTHTCNTIAQKEGSQLFTVHGPLEFHRDFQRVMKIVTTGPVKTFSAERLKFLQFKYQCHKLLNGSREERASLHDPKDFSSVMKVDTHIHLAAAMTGKHLLDYIRSKLATEPDRVVEKNKDGEPVTLQALFANNSIDMERFTVDALDVRGDDVFHRFDNFNSHYNPFGKSELRTVFLKTR
jgi:AMP deaminase